MRAQNCRILKAEAFWGLEILLQRLPTPTSMHVHVHTGQLTMLNVIINHKAHDPQNLNRVGVIDLGAPVRGGL